MANYVNITLDTVAPAGVSVLVNGDAEKTTSSAVTLTIACEEAADGYQMKIWGTADAPTENSALWETYQATKNVVLPAGDGLKTVYVKVRDDVWNESAPVSDAITLYEKLPSVAGLSVNTSKISLVNGKNVTSGHFGFDENIDAVKIMIVQNVNDAHDTPTNIAIPRTNGSGMSNDNEQGTLSDAVLECEGMIDCVGIVYFDIYAADIASVAPGDGIKIVKVFVRSAETGSWSV